MANLQCKTFGLCNASLASAPLCLSVWRGEVHDGAPLVWARCRNDVYAHQQWHKVGQRAHGKDMGAQERGGGEGGQEGEAASFVLQLGAQPPSGDEGIAEGGRGPSHEPLCAAVPMPVSLLV